MEYKICKLQFSTGLHIGKGMLTDGEPIFMADTFFSALCHEQVAKAYCECSLYSSSELVCFVRLRLV